MGISGNADVAGFVELRNAIKITSDIQKVIKIDIKNKLDNVKEIFLEEFGPFHSYPTPEQIQQFIDASKVIIREAYSGYIDDTNDTIIGYIVQDIETKYTDLMYQLDDIIIEIQERTKNKKELSGSGKSRTYKQKDLDLFVRTFDMKRFL